MSAIVDIKLGPEVPKMIEVFGNSAGLQRTIAREMDNQNNLTIAHISTVRMRGNNGKPFPASQHILGIRSGQLYQSLRASKVVISGNTIVSSIGTNKKYAAIHEFGGTIKRVQVAGSVRLATDRQGNLLRRGRNGKLAVFARKERKSAVTVPFAGGKRIEITIPARAPITTGIQDRAADIGAGLTRAIVDFYTQKNGGQP